MPRDFVLVHGMSHGAWCWELLEPLLRRAGHRVLAVDLPGHGRRAHERGHASIATYTRAVADAMTLAGVHDAIVVGHSMAVQRRRAREDSGGAMKATHVGSRQALR